MIPALVRALASLRVLPFPLAALATFATFASAPACGTAETRETTPLTVWAFEERLHPADPSEVDAPLAGALVAFDPPGGGARVVRPLEADGHATFEGDFAAGTATVTVYSPQHLLVSLIETSPEAAARRPNAFGKPASDLVVVVPRLDDGVRARSVELRGKLANRRAAASTVDVSASSLRRLGSFATKTDEYALRVPRDRPFFLLGHEIENVARDGAVLTNVPRGSFRIDVPARSADGVLDIDVAAAAPLPTRTVRVRLDKPAGARALFGDGSRGTATVVSAESELLLGAIESAKPTADGAGFEVAMRVAETDIGSEHALTMSTLTAPDGSRSVRFDPGVAADGATLADFLPPLVVGQASRSITDPIPLDGFPAGADLVVEVYAGGQLGWLVLGPPGGSKSPAFVLPAPLEIRFPELVALAIEARADPINLPPRGAFHRRVATSRDVPVHR